MTQRLPKHAIIIVASPNPPYHPQGGLIGMYMYSHTNFWGLSYLKIQKLQHFPFLFFDRYDIHIPDFEDFLYGDLHHFRSPSSHNLIKMRYWFSTSKFQVSNFPNFKFSKFKYSNFQISNCRIYKFPFPNVQFSTFQIFEFQVLFFDF